MAISFNKLPITDVIFTHFDEKTKKQTHYAVTRLRKQIITGLEKGWAIPTTIPIQKDIADFCTSRRGVESHRLARLLQLETEYEPLLFLTLPNNTHLLVDGTHRYVASFLKNKPTIKAIVVNMKHSKRFVIKDYPKVLESQDEEKVIKSFSGIF